MSGSTQFTSVKKERSVDFLTYRFLLPQQRANYTSLIAANTAISPQTRNFLVKRDPTFTRLIGRRRVNIRTGAAAGSLPTYRDFTVRKQLRTLDLRALNNLV